MTDEQIIKALECCLRVVKNSDVELCHNCPLNKTKCSTALPKNALDLINRQKAEIEKFENIKETVDAFWDILMRFKIFKGTEIPTLEIFAEALRETENIAVRKFAERLKATDLSGTVGEKYVNGEMYGYFHNGAFERIVDNLLAELTPTALTKVDHSSLCETETYEG